ncbi:Phytochrome two-component sensor histidine kinase Cyanobacterial phytochrome B [Paramagnetospirillum magnetotacticum MS-1]|uniref:histidine kinase n=1 Tax=Paramagnetospirillum magnetotacticum MS-1 TaxID=272627 RepID=A0A0C2V3M3_PARME|nr:MASE3 domain-containing protein [Paramagnetospirillum magnetotacticum]KIL99656.1 Phytochrome two-component sensor histidine kinase Cyanobacterial phytochrome B [Paramagnetospirillum magnetotacticum MS-1]
MRPDDKVILPLVLPPLLLVAAAVLCGAAVRIVPPGQVFENPAAYLAVHSGLELVSIAVSLMVFSLGWAVRHSDRSQRNLILGLAAMSASAIDIFHTLSYAGMPDLITPSGPEKAINLWLLGRLAMAAGLLLAILTSEHKLSGMNRRAWLGAVGVLTAGLIVVGVAHPDWFPRTFIPGSGLTPFKIVAEYVLSAAYTGAASLLYLRYRRTGDRNELKLAAAAWILALAGVLLTLYGDVGDFFNLAGHVGKALAYLLIYSALFVSGIKAPYAALAKEQALLRTLMDSVPDLIFFKDSQSRYLGYNRAFATYCGKPESEMIGKSDHEFAPAEVAEFYRAKDRDAMAAGRPSTNEEWIDYPDGRHVLLETVKAPIYDAKGSLLGMVGVSRDITDRKSAEESLRRAHYDLEMVTAVAAHDLQEPARTIVSFLQLLQLRYGDKLGEDAAQYIAYAIDGAHRMRDQLAGLLEYTMIDRGSATFPPTDTEAVLIDALDALKPKIDETKAVVSHGALPVVNADPGQIRVLFQHLIANAIKFHHEGRKPDISVTAARSDGAWEFSIADNGIGIDEAYWDKIFVVFQRLHSLQRYEGTGIGLAICRKIVERHGGRIRVVSAPDQGSTFTFTLPDRA